LKQEEVSCHFVKIDLFSMKILFKKVLEK